LGFQIALEEIADLPQAEFDTAIKLILHMGQEDLSTAWSAAFYTPISNRITDGSTGTPNSCHTFQDAMVIIGD